MSWFGREGRVDRTSGSVSCAGAAQQQCCAEERSRGPGRRTLARSCTDAAAATVCDAHTQLARKHSRQAAMFARRAPHRSPLLDSCHPRPQPNPPSPTPTPAIILGGGAGTRLYPLTKQRAKPAVPIGGAYRLIDVPMSNCINSGISKIYILTQVCVGGGGGAGG